LWEKVDECGDVIEVRGEAATTIKRPAADCMQTVGHMRSHKNRYV